MHGRRTDPFTSHIGPTIVLIFSRPDFPTVLVAPRLPTYHGCMRIFSSTLVGITTLFVGCSTVSVNQTPNILTMLPAMHEVTPGKDLESVDLYLTRRLAENPSEAMTWWTHYQRGRLWSQEDPARACRFFKDLGTDQEFPLRHISVLRALEVCPKDDSSLPPLEQVLTETSEPWLRELALRTVHARAKKVENHELEMRLAGDLSAHSKLQSEKVQLLSRALELAGQLERPEAKVEYKSRLDKIAPRFRQTPTPNTYLEVALDFRKAREFERAREYYRKAIAHKKTTALDRHKALDGIRLAYKLEKRVDEYVATTREMAEFARAKYRQTRSAVWAEKFHDSQLLLARTLWTEKTVPEAVQVIDRLEREITGRLPLDEILWLRARIAEEAGRYAAAVRILARAKSLESSNRPIGEKIQWYKAWNLRKLGRHKEAVDALKSLNTRFGTLTNKNRNRFWLAKSLKAIGQEEDAKSELESLIEDDPLGYYGVLSYRELGRELPPAQHAVRDEPGPAMVASQMASRTPAMTSSVSATPSPFATPHDHAYVEWLLALGEMPIARRFLEHDLVSRRPSLGDTPEGREFLKYLARAGDFHSLFARLGGFAPDVRSRVLAEDPSLLFPQPFSYFVSEAGQKFGVATELMYAIMRQESSFDPFARSHADAFGLMQLIPEAARRVEGTSGITLSSPEDLYRPEINVTLGAAFLRNLMDQYDEQFVLTVASYNASEKAIRGWMRTRFKGDALEFIEDIPYEETRGYVKLVLRNYIFYLRLNSGGRPVAFPEWCLDTLHDFNS